MKRFDAGFMGSIIKAWIKLARAEKSFLSKRIYSIVRNIAAKRVSTNTTVEKAVLNINWSKKIQQLSKKVINLGMTGWQEKEFVNQHLVQLKKVKDVVYKQSLLAKILRAVKIISGKEGLSGISLHTHGLFDSMVEQLSVRTRNVLFWGFPVKTFQKVLTGLLLIKKDLRGTGTRILSCVTLAI